jgi:hypothetical protein
MLSLQLVQESSVSLDYVYETLLHLSNVSHTTMCKFSDPGDVNYCILRDRLNAELCLSVSSRHDLDKNVPDWHSSDLTPLKLAEETSVQLRSIKEQLVASDAKLDKIQTGTHSSLGQHLEWPAYR